MPGYQISSISIHRFIIRHVLRYNDLTLCVRRVLFKFSMVFIGFQCEKYRDNIYSPLKVTYLLLWFCPFLKAAVRLFNAIVSTSFYPTSVPCERSRRRRRRRREVSALFSYRYPELHY